MLPYQIPIPNISSTAHIADKPSFLSLLLCTQSHNTIESKRYRLLYRDFPVFLSLYRILASSLGNHLSLSRLNSYRTTGLGGRIEDSSSATTVNNEQRRSRSTDRIYGIDIKELYRPFYFTFCGRSNLNWIAATIQSQRTLALFEYGKRCSKLSVIPSLLLPLLEQWRDLWINSLMAL